MTDQEILTSFNRILRDLLLDDSIVLRMNTRREDIANWDSFNYISFIVAVESEFGIKFKVADVESFENVGAIVTHLMAKQAPPELLGIHTNLPGTVPSEVLIAIGAGGPPPAGTACRRNCHASDEPRPGLVPDLAGGQCLPLHLDRLDAGSAMADADRDNVIGLSLPTLLQPRLHIS